MGVLDFLAGLFGGDDAERDDAAAADSRAQTDRQSGPSDDGSSAADEMGPAQFREDAEEAAEEWNELDLDFSVASLERLDEYAGGDDNLVATLGDELDGDGELLERMHRGYAAQFGSYFGEVLVRQFDGEWVETDGWSVVVPTGPDDGLEVAVFDVAAVSFADEPQFAAVVEELERELDAGGDANGAAASGAPDSDSTVEPVPVEGPVDDRRAAIVEEARELAEFWPEHELDFSPESLARLDAFVDEQWEKDRFRDASLDASGDPDHVDDAVYTGLVSQLGGYYGEVLVRNYDAEWTDSEDVGRTVVSVAGEETELVANVFHVAEDCLAEPSKFALSHDTVVDTLDLDAPRVSSGGGTTVRASTGDGGDGEDLVASLREDAAEFADEWPRYALDFTPDSLVRLDALVREEFDALEFDGVELGDEDDGDSVFLTAHAMAAGGYFGEVLRRSCGGEWRTDDGATLVVPGRDARARDAEARLDPVAIAADCFRGEDSFAATFEALRGQLDLDVDPIDDDTAFDAIRGPAAAYRIEADAAEDLRSAAEAFAADRDEYGLDGTPESLRRLDDLAGAVDDTELDADRLGAYLGTAFVAHYGARWTHDEDAGWILEIPDRTVDEEDPSVLVLPTVLRDCLEGDATFAAFHDTVLSELGHDGPELVPDAGGDEHLREEYAAAAEELAERWSGYDLDFSPASLARLDDLVADHFDYAPEDVDRESAGALETLPAGATLRTVAGEETDRVAGYVAEVFRRNADGAWRETPDGEVFVVEGADGSAELDATTFVSAAFSGHVSFAAAYESLAGEIGLPR